MSTRFNDRRRRLCQRVPVRRIGPDVIAATLTGRRRRAQWIPLMLRVLAILLALSAAACTQDMDPSPGNPDGGVVNPSDASAGQPDAAGNLDAAPQGDGAVPPDAGMDAGTDGGMDGGGMGDGGMPDDGGPGDGSVAM